MICPQIKNKFVQSVNLLIYSFKQGLGAAVRSIYEMLLPDFMEEVKGRRFGRGEGVVVLQGSELHFIKVGAVSNVRRIEEISIKL